MTLPEQLLLSDLLRRRVRCQQGVDHGAGHLGWMHPPVHRLLGWACRPSAFSPRRLVWRLDQLRGLSEQDAFVVGEPAEADQATLDWLPSLWDAALLGASGEPLAVVADAAVELRTGRIRHYLVARSDPRLPGSSRWRLDPARILDQQPGQVRTAIQGLDDLPLARSSVRQELLQRSRRWRRQMEEETSRWRDQMQQAGGRLEERLEGWLEEPPWDEPRRPYGQVDRDRWSPSRPGEEDGDPDGSDGPLPVAAADREPWEEDDWAPAAVSPPAPSPPDRRRPGPTAASQPSDDPWV